MTVNSVDVAALSQALPPLRGLGRVGLLGGSFNPPHLAHVMMAFAAYGVYELDHLWVMPCADHAFGKALAPFDDRVRMCHLAFRHFSGGVAVIDVENRLQKPSYTIDTLRALHLARPGIKPTLLVGSDVLSELHRWKEPEELKRLASILPLPRKGFAHPEAQNNLAFELPELSSNEIRARLREGLSIHGHVDEQVIHYLNQKRLYDENAAPALSDVLLRGPQ